MRTRSWVVGSLFLVAGCGAAAGNEGDLDGPGDGSGGSGTSASGGTANATGGVGTASGGSVASGGASTGGSSSSEPEIPLGDVTYQQTFDSLSAGLWKKNLDGSKIKAHPENSQVTAGCGPDDSTCFRVVYRQVDGIHKQPFSNPVFTTSGGVISWTPSDAGHTNTATDVIQANIHIDGSTTGDSAASNVAVPGKAYTLSYDLYFEPGFDFAKGGKLTGLAADQFDSGCSEDGSAKRQTGNWSERLMWRANGRIQLYSYDQSRASGSCGVEKTVDQVDGDPEFELPGTIPSDDKFRLQAGVWYTVRLSVRVNDNDSVTYLTDPGGQPILDDAGDPQPTGGNGAVSLAIAAQDGSISRTLVFSNVALRDECNGPCPATVPDSPATWVNGVFFSTFFGGNETKRTTCVNQASSTLAVVVSSPLPNYPGLTQPLFDGLCSSQKKVAIYPKLTWNPETPSAARFDNFVVREGFTTLPL